MGDSQYYPKLLVANEKYQLESFIGRGGMGEVWEAVNRTTGRSVALKFLRSDKPVEAAGRMRLLNEARCAVKHDHVVEVRDVEKLDHGVEFIVMERLEGKTLHHVLEEHRSLSISRATNIMLQLVSALGSIHHAGIVHRDLKPSNIFLIKRWNIAEHAKIIDFGIAKSVHDSTDAGSLEPVKEAAFRCGTVGYMAPEQMEAPHLSSYAADIFALGIVFYECLVGHHIWAPADRQHIEDDVYAHWRNAPRPFLDKLPSELHADLRCLIRDALHREPDQRISLDEMFNLLSRHATVEVPMLPATLPSAKKTSLSELALNDRTKTRSSSGRTNLALLDRRSQKEPSKPENLRLNSRFDEATSIERKTPNRPIQHRRGNTEPPSELEKFVGYLAGLLLAVAMWVGFIRLVYSRASNIEESVNITLPVIVNSSAEPKEKEIDRKAEELANRLRASAAHANNVDGSVEKIAAKSPASVSRRGMNRGDAGLYADVLRNPSQHEEAAERQDRAFKYMIRVAPTTGAAGLYTYLLLNMDNIDEAQVSALQAIPPTRNW